MQCWIPVYVEGNVHGAIRADRPCVDAWGTTRFGRLRGSDESFATDAKTYLERRAAGMTPKFTIDSGPLQDTH